MNTGKISARYAKALFLFASENQKEDVVYEEMKMLAQNFMDVPALKEAMKNPTVTKAKRKELLITAAGTNVSAEYTRFVDLVIEHKREEYFQGISLIYQEMYRNKKNIITSTLVTATPISDAEEARMRKAVESVTNGTIEFQKEVDPSLIGGFVLNVETYQLDASIKTQLREVRDTLMNRNSETA